jgi:hypothetical protein
MAITVTTTGPQALLEAILKAVKERHVDTWEYRDGYFTHSPAQWRGLAFLKPSVSKNTLLLNIFHPQGRNITSEIYAVYHGRFIEMLLAHFERMFDSARASALASQGDVVK